MPVKKSKKKKAAKKPARKVKKAAKPAKKTAKRAVKQVVKKPAAKPAVQQLPKAVQPAGVVTHFFDKISVAVVKLNKTVKLGDRVKIEGHGKSFEQTITSLQKEHEPLQQAKAGEEVGTKVTQPVKEHDLVYLV